MRVCGWESRLFIESMIVDLKGFGIEIIIGK